MASTIGADGVAAREVAAEIAKWIVTASREACGCSGCFAYERQGNRRSMASEPSCVAGVVAAALFERAVWTS